jgi:molybdenum cofactor cytidylyltransferase
VISFATVLLAAGASSRMGQPKLLLPWGATTVIGHLLQLWQQIGAAQTSVVCAAQNEAFNAELNRLHFPREQRILNEDPSRGMFSSVKCAAEWSGWKESITHWAIALGDQPHLSGETLSALVGFAAQHRHSICQASHRGRPRHPVLVPEPLWQTLAGSTDATLKDFLEAHRDARAFIEINDPGLDLDIDRPADYETALKLFPHP